MSDHAIAFTYRKRYETDSSPTIPVRTGESITLDERKEYVVELAQPLSAQEASQLAEVGGEVISPKLVLLSFGNFVGASTLLGVGLNVVSSKLGEGGASRLLEEVSNLATNLVYGWRSPTSFQGQTDASGHSPVPYHQLQAIREAMLRRRPGIRLQDWLDHIARNPTRRFDSHRSRTPPHRVRRLDHQGLTSVFARLDRLAAIPTSNVQLASNRLATALTFGCPPKQHFPTTVSAPQIQLSFDTLENRFVRHALRECIAIVGRFSAHPKLHQSLRTDCGTMLAMLEEAIASPHLAELSPITALQSPSQVLVKAEGYRDLFGFWMDLTRSVSLPPSARETARMLEGRDVATLYEYWVFLKVLQEASQLLGTSQPCRPKLVRSDLDERFGYGCMVELNDQVRVEFNASFTRGLKSAYSTPLRPDVTLTVAGVRHAFDAKYRLDRLALDDEGVDEAKAFTYKRADLYKMHTYRDAIRDLRAAFVVYPGTDFAFFERHGSAHRSAATIAAIQEVDGVGAVPLRPADADPGAVLRSILARVLRGSTSGRP